MHSFTDLYERRADYVYFLCSRLEENEELANRLNQDVWRRVHRQLPQLQSRREEIWLCTKLVDSHRRLHPNTRVEGAPDFRGTSDMARLHQAVVSLPLERRWPLVFREYAGFGYDEIADILNIPKATVRARLARARSAVNKLRSEASL